MAQNPHADDDLVILSYPNRRRRAVEAAATDRTLLIGKSLTPATYLVSDVDVRDFMGVVDEPAFSIPPKEINSVSPPMRVPPSFAPLIAVLGLLRTFDWHEDFWFDYQTGTAMFGEQFLEFHRPIVIGETVRVEASISDVYEKQGKKLFDVIEVSFTIADNDGRELLMSGKQSYILFKS